MPRWIVYEEETAARLSAAVPAAAAMERRPPPCRETDALAALLDDEDAGADAGAGRGPALALLPGSAPGEVLMVQRERKRPVPARAPGQPIAYEAAGFLGLHDEPVYAEEPPPRSWWQRLWG